MGRVIKYEGGLMDTATTEKLKAFVRGEMTWAEVEGMTFEEAKAIAQVGCDLAAAGRCEEARILFEGLVEGNPKDTASRAALGTVYQKLGRLQDAMREYSAALERDPRNPVALVNRGELYLRQGNRQGFTDIANAVEADPHGETSAGRRARALVKAIALAAVEKMKEAKAQA
ncbi:tetratricopeptide repeat protein [Archangium violaceum]|uniref:tetratricopeptide repeat protein n=1 Tax=Archangium violaceum TaxID=83451 RepID=UPI0019509B4C|nr:tetratricopeptide repeat protein [Archangium violaceum]QRN99664.1 tetratricopeptide repeat protein [Archangium violaceum]